MPAATSPAQYSDPVLFELREDIRANLTRMLDKIETFNLVVDRVEEQYTRGITDPSIVSKMIS